MGCSKRVGPGLPPAMAWRCALFSLLSASVLACRQDVAADRNPWYDRDGDSIGTATELDSLNHALYHFDTSRIDRNPSRALGTPDSGTLDSGIHLFPSWAGYRHFRGSDTVNTDDWGTLALVNSIQGAGRCLDAVNFSRRSGVLDLSRQYGGSFPPHVSHQNGRDVDVRYLRNDRVDTLGLDLRLEPNRLDTNMTLALWNCFVRSPRVEFLIIDSVYFRQFIQNHTKLLFDTSRSHANNFHVRILDPDSSS